jgi:hypothetical protein
MLTIFVSSRLSLTHSSLHICRERMFALLQRTAAARSARLLALPFRSSALFAAASDRQLSRSLFHVQRHCLLRNLASSVIPHTLFLLLCFAHIIVSSNVKAVAHVESSRIAEAKRRKDKAEADLDYTQSELAHLWFDVTASEDDIQRARESADRAHSAWLATIKVHLWAINAEIAADRAGRRVREVPFSFKAGVKERLSRPLDQWQAGETFDVAGVGAAIGADQWQDVLFLRAEGLAVLREWEGETPFLAVYGTVGIGKSTLQQLAAMRALVLGNPVLLHVRGENTLIELVDDTPLRVERLTLDDIGFNGRPSAENTIMCYDSPDGFEFSVGHADYFKKTLIVHSPSGDLTNTRKADGIRSRYFPVPTEAELVALGALVRIEADEVRRRVARYGPIIRYVFNTVEAEKSVQLGIETTVARGVKGLVDFYKAPRDVYRIMQMVRKPTPVGVMLVFASDYVRDEVVRRVAEKHEADLLRLVNTVDLPGSLCDQVLESRLLDTFSRAGAEIKFKTSTGDKVLKIAGDSVSLRFVDEALAPPADESTLRTNVLYLPTHSSNAPWDALIVEDASVAYLLQMTVAKELPVKRHGLVAGSALLKAHGFAGAVQLVFLVPPFAFERFKVPQPIVDVDGTQSATTTGEQQWPQDKWQVAAVDGVGFWFA